MKHKHFDRRLQLEGAWLSIFDKRVRQLFCPLFKLSTDGSASNVRCPAHQEL